MKMSLSWLASYLPGPAPDPATAAERLTSVGFIVEGTEGDGAGTVFDVEVTANRPDGMNHRGLAREAAVAMGREFKDPGPGAVAESGTPASELAAVVIEAGRDCTRYSGRVIEGIRMGPASAAVRARLESIGSNPISGPVDATNHVLWDIGQPLHAFDLDKLAKGKDGRPTIVVRMARPGEKLVTLDEVERTLTADQLVIADAEKPLALAGVMGGLQTAISDSTTRILLESAHFRPGAVRRTAKLNGMHTDASHRYERGTDPLTTLDGLDRAARMIVADCGGAVRPGVIDALGDASRPFRGARLTLRLPRLARFLGMEVPVERCLEVLAALGFAPARKDDLIEVTVPSWRIDVQGEVDLFEEIIRCVGYDKLPETMPGAYVPGESAAVSILEDQARDHLAALGLTEAQNYSFVSGAENAPFVPAGPGEAVEIENPLGEPFSTLRATPVVGLLRSAQHNVRRSREDLAFFEVGRSFGWKDGNVAERRSGAFLLAGKRQSHWSGTARDADFYDGAGIVAGLFAGLGARPPRFEPASFPFLADGRSARIVTDEGAVAGWVGVLTASLAEGWDLSDPVVGDIDLNAIPKAAAVTAVEIPSRFPGSAVDLTVTHRKEVAWRLLDEAARRNGPAELLAVEANNRYEGPGVAPGFVKTNLSLRFGSTERSLSREEVIGWRDAAARSLLALPDTRVDGIQ
jgi:phenylalanyl-tRNA synthetase beta chain